MRLLNRHWLFALVLFFMALRVRAAEPFDQAKALADLEARLAGHEAEPAEKVFKDIQLLKGMPAGRLLKVMQFGYARSLGVDCTHCHVPGKWESDEKPQKQITREMAKMSQAINQELLPKIAGLKSEKPVVNCTTCHRGEVKPATDLKLASKP